MLRPARHIWYRLHRKSRLLFGDDRASLRRSGRCATARCTSWPMSRLARPRSLRAEGISFAEAIRRPRNLMVGTPAMIADTMQDLFESEACDGFVLTPTISPVMWEEFARMLTPELQRRGLLRTDYTGATMRENLRS